MVRATPTGYPTQVERGLHTVPTEGEESKGDDFIYVETSDDDDEGARVHTVYNNQTKPNSRLS